ncbi:MAG TPA: hypothetical protein VGQ26_12300 [Streptosporangiaceae bacterium]|nr:hypothetical protein [Streptosporangiaceae bacterium]
MRAWIKAHAIPAEPAAGVGRALAAGRAVTDAPGEAVGEYEAGVPSQR